MTKEDMHIEIIAQNEFIKKNGKEHEIINIFQTKWQAKILFELLNENPLRYIDFLSRIPDLPRSSLSATLDKMEASKLITRTLFDDGQIRVEYSLTDRAAEMLPIFFEMMRWEQKFMSQT